VQTKSKYAMKNAVTTQKAAKRPYIKKGLRTQDELWKVIVPILWDPFLRFCLEDLVDKIDFTRKPDFLDKELKRLMLRSKSKNRTVDFLMRIYFKDGTTKFFLLHIEVQGYPDPEFPKRVFQYYYRISDLLQEDIETLAVMIDDDPNWRPDEYVQKFGKTKVHFTFRMFKLLDNPPPYTGKEDNPFSIVFEVAWYGLKQNMLKNDDDLATLKFRLIRRLLENNTDVDLIYKLLEFINIYLPFKKPEKTLTFDREIEVIIDKDKNMEATTIRELYGRHLREVERKIAQKEIRKEVRKTQRELAKAELRRQEEARLRQEEARLHQEEARLHQETLAAVIFGLHNQGFSVEDIAKTMSKPLDFVQGILDKK
jgi:hypothetical protein